MHGHAQTTLISCVSVLQSHTVLSELYQEMLVTEDEVKALEEVEDLPNELISIQCTKPPEVVTRTADVLDTFGHNAEARKLRGWYVSQTTQQ